MTPIYEGKAKRLFETDNPNELLMEFKDDATAFNGAKHELFTNKGTLNKQLTTLIFKMLEKEGIETHLIEDRDETHQIVKRVQIILIEVVVRNIACGSLCKRTGIPEGQKLRQPMVEYFYKDDALGDPMITGEHIREMELATPEEVENIKRQALRINGLLVDFFAKANLTLVDFKIEFGRLSSDPSRIILADEITPDTCRLWDMETGKKMDKDRFRENLGDVMENYAEVLSRAEHAVSS